MVAVSGAQDSSGTSKHRQTEPSPQHTRNVPLQTLLTTTQSKLWCPDFDLTLRILAIVRLFAAIYSNIQDCDEVFNFWEPAHYLHYGTGLQTWEYAPQYSIRSWAYVLVHAIVTSIFEFAMTTNKIQVFYMTRAVLAIVSAFTEATMVQAIADHLHPRIARYTLLFLVLSPGMFAASTAFLPSTFAMYTTTWAFALWLQPSSRRNTWMFTCISALGAIWGWPFAAILVVPFIVEQLMSANRLTRFIWMLEGSAIASVAILGPLLLIDRLFYKRWVVAPLNIVLYNILGGQDRGPSIYGTEPWHFYFANGLLNFNLAFPCALACFPLLIAALRISPSLIYADISRFKLYGQAGHLTLCFSLFYGWLAIFTLQPHKEERFLFVVFPIICFCAAYSLYLARGIAETLFLIVKPLRPKAAILSSWITPGVLVLYGIVSILRIHAGYWHYHAPFDVYTAVAAASPPAAAIDQQLTLPEAANRTVAVAGQLGRTDPQIAEILDELLLKDNFDGFAYVERRQKRMFSDYVEGMNDVNREEHDRYWPLDKCDYIVDTSPRLTDTASDQRQYDASATEPHYAWDTEHWEQVYCRPFLDASKTGFPQRAFSIPGQRQPHPHPQLQLQLQAMTLQHAQLSDPESNLENKIASVRSRIEVERKCKAGAESMLLKLVDANAIQQCRLSALDAQRRLDFLSLEMLKLQQRRQLAFGVAIEPEFADYTPTPVPFAASASAAAARLDRDRDSVSFYAGILQPGPPQSRSSFSSLSMLPSNGSSAAVTDNGARQLHTSVSHSVISAHSGSNGSAAAQSSALTPGQDYSPSPLASRTATVSSLNAVSRRGSSNVLGSLLNSLGIRRSMQELPLSSSGMPFGSLSSVNEGLAVSTTLPLTKHFGFLCTDTPITSDKVKFKLSDVLTRLDVEQHVRQGTERMLLATGIAGGSSNTNLADPENSSNASSTTTKRRQEVEDKMIEANARVNLLSKAVARYQGLYVNDESDGMTLSEMPASPGSPTLPYARPPAMQFTGKLTISPISAMGLPGKKSSKTDLYVVVRIDGNQRAKSRTSRGKWSDQLIITVDKASDVEIAVYEKNGTILALLGFSLEDLCEELNAAAGNSSSAGGPLTTFSLGSPMIESTPSNPIAIPSTTNQAENAALASASAPSAPVSTLAAAAAHQPTKQAAGIEAYLDMEPMGQILVRLNFVRDEKPKKTANVGVQRQRNVQKVFVRQGHKLGAIHSYQTDSE
eukprot:jgi/Hompol1/6644/HPOL_000759-RA